MNAGQKADAAAVLERASARRTYLVHVCPICLSQAHGTTVWCVGNVGSPHGRVRVEARKAMLIGRGRDA